MKVLTFEHRLRIDFSNPVVRNHFTLRCLPADGHGQIAEDARLVIKPECDFVQSKDFSGLKQWGCVQEAHTCFEAIAQGRVITGFGQEKVTGETGMYARQSAFTVPGKNILSLYSCLPQACDDEAFAEAVMDMLEKRFDYLPGVTGFTTRAEESAAAMKGVCQDAVHIMLALLRIKGIPCRYIMGYVPGEGATHAWAEVQTGSYWKRYDPVNRTMDDESYITVSAGRDAEDCPVNRGIFFGSAVQSSTSSVHVSAVG